MNMNNRLSNAEYEKLSLEYEQNPPALSGKSGFLTVMRERMLLLELLSPDYARIVYIKAKALSLSPSEFVQNAIKMQLIENVWQQKSFFDTLSTYYLNNRYPDFMNNLSSQIKKEEAAKTLSQTKEVFPWLLTLKPWSN